MASSTGAPGYLWDNSAKAEVSKRFRSLESLYDPNTFAHLENRGISEGWRCLEVGGGSGSVARWMSTKVGARGRILVTDINPVFLREMKDRPENLEVLRHDITKEDGLPKDSFDLAHSRLVLIHLSQREKALANIVSTLKHGGWVVIEDFDFISPDTPRDYHPTLGLPPTMTTPLFNKVILARNTLLQEHGADPYYARRLYSILRRTGLVDVGISAAGNQAWPSNSPGAELQTANTLQSREEMIATGILSEKEFDDSIKLMSDPEWISMSPLMVSAWGRKP